MGMYRAIMSLGGGERIEAASVRMGVELATYVTASQSCQSVNAALKGSLRSITLIYWYASHSFTTAAL